MQGGGVELGQRLGLGLGLDPASCASTDRPGLGLKGARLGLGAVGGLVRLGLMLGLGLGLGRGLGLGLGLGLA